jgi:dipeptidyl aminopeptidase/acylaminoacyl peptidase
MDRVDSGLTTATVSLAGADSAGRSLKISDLTTIAVPEQPAISADAAKIAYVLRSADLKNDRDERHLWQVEIDSGKAEAISAGPALSPAWSPDGTRLAFLHQTDERRQIWIAGAGIAPVQLTDLALGAGAPMWSPDGTKIAFTAPVSTRQDPAAPLVISRLDYLADGEGMVWGRRQHIHVLDLSSGECLTITSGDWNAGAPAWSPDGKSIAFSAGMDADADLSRRSAAYIVEIGGSASPQLVGSADGWAGPLAWTPEGSALIVAGSFGPPNRHIRLLRVEVASGKTTDLTASLDRNVMYGSPGYPGAPPAVLADGTVLFCLRERGCTHLYRVHAEGGTPLPLVTGEGKNVSGVSVCAGRAVFVLTTPRSFGEVASVDLTTGEVDLHTDYGKRLAGITIHPREEREFVISDGTVVQGWVIGSSGAGPRPLLLDIHGGPHNAWNAAADEVHLYHQELVSEGWTVLLLNPRGSDGYGEDFFTAVHGGWGVNDAQDFLEPIAELIAEGIADPQRIAVTGYSYGGYMTCYLTSHHPQFAAAVAGGPVTDLTSMAGTADNRRGLSESEFGGRPWEERERYAAMSPLDRIEDVEAPTLILQGEADVRCPLGQAQQWHTALRERGIPTQLVLYPGSSHAFIINGRPSHRLDYNRRVFDWLHSHVH